MFLDDCRVRGDLSSPCPADPACASYPPIELPSVLAEMCTVRATALRPETLHLRAHPKTWRDRFAHPFGQRFELGDPDFDEHWSIETDNEPVAKRLL